MLDESYNPLLVLKVEFETGHTTLRPPGDWALNGNGIAWNTCHYWPLSTDGNPEDKDSDPAIVVWSIACNCPS